MRAVRFEGAAEALFGLDGVAEGRGKPTEGSLEVPVEEGAVGAIELGVGSQLEVEGPHGGPIAQGDGGLGEDHSDAGPDRVVRELG